MDCRGRRRVWPCKNTPEQIVERQNVLRALPGWDEANAFIFDWPRPAAELAGVVEALTAHVVLPVSVVGNTSAASRHRSGSSSTNSMRCMNFPSTPA